MDFEDAVRTRSEYVDLQRHLFALYPPKPTSVRCPGFLHARRAQLPDDATMPANRLLPPYLT